MKTVRFTKKEYIVEKIKATKIFLYYNNHDLTSVCAYKNNICILYNLNTISYIDRFLIKP